MRSNINVHHIRINLKNRRRGFLVLEVVIRVSIKERERGEAISDGTDLKHGVIL